MEERSTMKKNYKGSASCMQKDWSSSSYCSTGSSHLTSHIVTHISFEGTCSIRAHSSISIVQTTTVFF